MITIKDIAKKAGVSSGTVSNVLNKRGNTSLKKIQLVENAAKELGYFYNENASSLRSNKKKDVALIIPTLEYSFYRRIFDTLSHELNLLNVKLNLHITNFNPQNEMNTLRQCVATNKYLIIGSSLKDNSSFYKELSISDSELIFINSNHQNENSNFFSLVYDYGQFYKDINKLVSLNKYQKIMFFSDKEYFTTEQLNNLNITTRISFSIYSDLSTAIESLYNENYDLIITTSLEKYRAINTATMILNQNKEIHIVSIVDSDYLPCSNMLPYYQDTGVIVKNIIKFITNKKKLCNMTLSFNGFSELSTSSFKGDNINLLMIDSPSTSALIKIKSYIEEKIGFKFNIDIINYNDYDLLLDENYIKNYDLVRIDMAHLPEMAKNLFVPLNTNLFNLKNKFIDNIDEYIYVDKIAYALPFDVSCLVMMYRNDILSDQLIQRQFYEQSKSTNIIPTTYEEYNNLEAFFLKNYKDTYNPSTVCLGSSITASNEFLIRLNINYTFKDETLDISDPAIKNALDSYLTSVKNSKSKINVFWDDVIKEYSEGNTILSIVYSNYVHMLSNMKKDILFKTNFTTIPNNYSYIGGGVVGLTKTTTKEKLVYKFLEALYSDEICKLLTHLGATLPTQNIYSDFTLTSIYPWLKLIPKALESNKRRRYNNNGESFNTIHFEKAIGRQVKKYIEDNLK